MASAASAAYPYREPKMSGSRSGTAEKMCGADGRNRTGNLLITIQLLCLVELRRHPESVVEMRGGGEGQS